MLKDNGKSKGNKNNKGSYIFCPKCKKKIYVNSQDEKENIIKIGNTRVYECECGHEFLLD